MSDHRYKIEVRANLPKELKELDDLANNLIYSWDRRVRRVFRYMDPELWDKSNHRPKVLLKWISQSRLDELAQDRNFYDEFQHALAVHRSHLAKTENPHPDIARRLKKDAHQIAYFCAEFGLHESLPIYSGGLGILAGDHLKAASELGLPMVAVGLMYHQGYFTQCVDSEGRQHARTKAHQLDTLPIKLVQDASQQPLRISVPFPGREIKVQIWQASVGHLPLYLLDTDVEDNDSVGRAITNQLYGGDHTTRLAQEWVLGLGGVKALRALNITPTVWHINEGHAACSILERTRELVAEGLDFESALEAVANATLFTTHTPVPAGHDIFTSEEMARQLEPLAAQMQIPVKRLLALGSASYSDHKFNMTSLGLHGSRFHNGVSQIHGRVASHMEASHWPQIPADENPITHVTNGVHVLTFLAREWANLFDTRYHGWRDRVTDKQYWHIHVDKIPDPNYWNIRQLIKTEMLQFVSNVLRKQYLRNSEGEANTEHLLMNLSPYNADPPMIIGFARRFATYKRATLIFKDLGRLARLLNNPEAPVVLLFAGKAHPADQPGQELIRQITEISKQPPFLGKVFYIEDYDLALARHLVAGVDVWLNNPEYPLEACGTSGQKAGINGVLNVSILDGWWAEAYDGVNGWGITSIQNATPENRDAAEAQNLMGVLEHEVIPLYFDRDGVGYSREWINRSKAAMASIIPAYSAHRMLLDYCHQFYIPASNRHKKMAAHRHQTTIELTRWKQKIHEAWSKIHVIRLHNPTEQLNNNEIFHLQLEVFLNGLSAEDIHIECVLGYETPTVKFKKFVCYKLEFSKTINDNCLFELNIPLTENGLFDYELRLYPSHPALAHPFEMGYMLCI